MSPERLPCARVVGSLRCYSKTDRPVDVTKAKNCAKNPPIRLWISPHIPR